MLEFTVLLVEVNDPANVIIFELEDTTPLKAFESAAKELYNDGYCGWSKQDIIDCGSPFNLDDYKCIAVFAGMHSNLYTEIG